jgi:hypothetical protein
MAPALSFRDICLTALTDRPPRRAEIVVNDIPRAGVQPAQIVVRSFQPTPTAGRDLQQRSMLWRT